MWKDEIEHHFYHLDSLASLSVDTLGSLPEDENGFSFIVVIVDNFSKFVGLYPARSTTSKDFIGAFMQWVGIFGVSPRKSDRTVDRSSRPSCRRNYLLY